MAGQDEKVRAISIEVDPESRLVTAVGSQRAVEQFTNTLRMIEGNVTVDRDAKRMVIEHALPSEVAASLNAFAPALLQPTDGSQYIAPAITGVDSLKTLVITATPAISAARSVSNDQALMPAPRFLTAADRGTAGRRRGRDPVPQ